MSLSDYRDLRMFAVYLAQLWRGAAREEREQGDDRSKKEAPKFDEFGDPIEVDEEVC